MTSFLTTFYGLYFNQQVHITDYNSNLSLIDAIIWDLKFENLQITKYKKSRFFKWKGEEERFVLKTADRKRRALSSRVAKRVTIEVLNLFKIYKIYFLSTLAMPAFNFFLLLMDSCLFPFSCGMVNKTFPKQKIFITAPHLFPWIAIDQLEMRSDQTNYFK